MCTTDLWMNSFLRLVLVISATTKNCFFYTKLCLRKIWIDLDRSLVKKIIAQTLRNMWNKNNSFGVLDYFITVIWLVQSQCVISATNISYVLTYKNTKTYVSKHIFQNFFSVSLTICTIKPNSYIKWSLKATWKFDLFVTLLNNFFLSYPYHTTYPLHRSQR